MFELNSKTKKLYTTISIICIISLLTAYYINNDRECSSEKMDRKILHVHAMTITQKQSSQHLVYSGEVRGRYESQLAFQVGGEIVSRCVDTGSQVKKGQLLMQINPKDIDQLVNSYSAMVESAKSQLQLAEKDFNRYRSLFEQEVISRAQMDRFQSAYDMAIAGYRNANAMYAQSANKLDYCNLHTGYDGVISSIMAESGQVVGTGQPVITIVRDGDREIEIYVPENRLQNLQNASQIRITFWAMPGVTSEGKIREIAPMADPITRTYKVRVNIHDEIPCIKLGMTASVELVCGQDNEIFIPLSSLYQTSSIPRVWIIQDGVLQLREIKIGDYASNSIQVLKGLKSGEMIVTAGVHKLREGLNVKVLRDYKS